MLRDAHAENIAWLPGERADIQELMRAMDLFVLPSIGEGISNTILEAMSSELAVIATNVGGNIELVKDGYNGKLVTPKNLVEMTAAIMAYYTNPELAASHGKAGRRQVIANFSMEAMVRSYTSVYDTILRQ